MNTSKTGSHGKFLGTGVALVTPFKKDLSVDVEALKKIVQFQLDNGVNYLVVMGTTGESVTLNAEEKQLAINTIVEANNGKLPLVLGVGGNNTAQVVSELQTADLENFDAILSVSPAYNKPTQEGIYQHFKSIAEHSPLPIILYNVPGRTASNMLPETVKRLAEDFENIIGIKEAAGDMVQAMQLISMVPNDFLVISGDDMIALPMVLAGGSGVISVIGEGFPKEFSTLINLGLKRKVDAAYEIQYRIAPAIELIFAEGNPAGIKAVFKKLGLAEDVVRLPLVSASEKLSGSIDKFVEGFGTI
ncbi:MAG TPA: 4-hydroxy-tetrahydrodipicolinate synthase [Flavobacteriaceae bacterium]|nr:4-hydroxy-tetrahydrodipicolinate synthase [Flavobacteriaceae bacterium]